LEKARYIRRLAAHQRGGSSLDAPTRRAAVESGWWPVSSSQQRNHERSSGCGSARADCGSEHGDGGWGGRGGAHEGRGGGDRMWKKVGLVFAVELDELLFGLLMNYSCIRKNLPKVI
jgi:hypothetical protein